MRPEFDSEIDSVLRGHARRGGAPSGAWEGLRPSIPNEAATVSHLDADEIAAFGENALPAAARARYTAHLADCDDCRRSVAQVAMAAGVADRIEARERGGVAVAAAAGAFSTPPHSAATPSSSVAAQSPSWRERVAAFFSPRAWRYAMPVVALVAVSAVVLVVTRNVPREGSLEKVGSTAASAERVSAPPAPETHHAGTTQPQQHSSSETQSSNANAAGLTSPTVEDADQAPLRGEVSNAKSITVDGLDQAGGGTVGTAAGPRPQAAQPTQAEPPAPPVTRNYETVTVTAGTPSPVPPAAAPQRQISAREVVPPPPAPHVHTEVPASERSRDDERAATVPRDEAPATKRHGPQRSMSRSADLSSTANAAKDDRTAASRRASGPQNNSQNNAQNNSRSKPEEAKSGREEDREQQAETRVVGGRRFRRDGNVWIDTAYRSGQATVVVRRDSEQYRALVGDEPEIGRISRALGGEAVIVWKGRAYRVKP